MGAAFIVLATIAVYMPAIRGKFIWDDPDYVINNHTLRTFDGLVEMWTRPQSLPQWYPMVHTTFWVEYQLWELSPLGYHLDNVLVHCASALILWRILKSLEIPGGWLAAAIFALHPVHVESVAWITERKNVLSGLFYLLSLLFYLNARDEKWLRNYSISLILFIAALLSKSVTASLPAAILVILWWKNGKVKWKDVQPLIPFFVLGIAMGLITAYLELHHVGADSERIAELKFLWYERLLIAGRVPFFYAAKLLVPWPLSFIYPRWELDPKWQWIFPAMLLATLAILVMARNHIGRAPAAAALIFVGTLFPVLGFLNVYPMRFSFVADHFQYHASIALIVLAAAGFCKHAGRYGQLVVIPLAILTALRTPVYADPEILWRDTLAKNPESWMVNTNLALVLRERAERSGDDPSQFDEAEKLFDKALLLAPNIHDTHTNVGMMLARRGQYEQALFHFREALKVNPNFAPAYYGIGQVYKFLGKTDLAIENYRKALEFSPKYPEGSYQLAQVLENTGRPGEAVDLYRTAVAGMPNNADARYDLAHCLMTLKQYPEAAANLLEAVRIRPNYLEAWYNLGVTQLLAGRNSEAVQSFQQALQINPQFAPARAALQRAMSH